MSTENVNFPQDAVPAEQMPGSVPAVETNELPENRGTYVREDVEALADPASAEEGVPGTGKNTDASTDTLGQADVEALEGNVIQGDAPTVVRGVGEVPEIAGDPVGMNRPDPRGHGDPI